MSKPHALLRIKESLTNTPHLIEQNSFNSIMDYINNRSEMGISENVEMVKEKDRDYNYNPDTKTGVLYVNGPLTAKTTGWEAWCGGTSYQMLKEQMEGFVDSGAKTVAMIVDSGGGEAYSMMDSANYIRKLADENGIQIITFVDRMAASAGYGLACIGDEIIMASDSQVGSIGVLIQLYNDSKHLEMNGYERTFITAGADKVPWDDEGNFTKNFLNSLKEQVDTLYEGFTSHVADHRSITQESVKNTEANVFMAKEAIRLGLADKEMTIEEFYNYVADAAQSRLEGNTVGNRLFKLTKKEDATEMSQLTEMQAQLSAAQEQLAAMATLSAQVTEMQASFSAQAEELKAAREALAEVEKAKAEATLEQRKAALSEVLPVDQLETAMSAYAGMDEAAFAFTVSTLKAAKEAAAGGEMMTESGGEGIEKEAELDATSALLKASVDRAKALKRQ